MYPPDRREHTQLSVAKAWINPCRDEGNVVLSAVVHKLLLLPPIINRTDMTCDTGNPRDERSIA